jgi:leucyl-tRNA synthetase
LIEFPYPSGDGLHTGHLRSNTAMDIICRKRRMEGKEVLYPIGFDAFGLPTENYAIKQNRLPQEVTAENIATFTRQLKEAGFSFDWSRSYSTTDPEYYKWTQWIFIQMFKRGLAHKTSETINWCPACKIGLANEEVIGGACERCGSEVTKKEKEQWILKITKYADRLIDDLDQVDFLERIKAQQINWIGRSHGAEVDFAIQDTEDTLRVFTTRPDTLFGATFMVVAPEHKILEKYKDQISNWSEVEEYINQAKNKTDIERLDASKDKTGIKLFGLEAVNPVNQAKLAIFVADYVLTSYGTGAIMAVPAHDQRDWEFAKQFKLPIIPVISGGDVTEHAFTEIEEGKMKNSGEFDGISSKECSQKITEFLANKNLGKFATNYKLRDWIFSRQRYWGEPIPMINCQKCGWQTVPEDQLPVELPDIDDFKPTADGQSPLAKVNEWANTTCPQCGGTAQRETDVMPNWAGSNWYFVRYADAKNNKVLADSDKVKYWLPVDWYNGGMEHTTLHLLYSRFVYKFLYDIKAVPQELGSEPYKKRTAHGMILGEGGVKMSKSKGNVINPDTYLEKYGADTVRLYEMFMGPFDQSIAWDDKGVVGAYRFLNRVWDLKNKIADTEDSKEVLQILHQTIRKVGDDIENMHFNTAVSQLMILIKVLEKQEKISEKIWHDFTLILAPFTPHIAEEMWNLLGNKDSLSAEAWPQYDENFIKLENKILAIQINGKVRDTIELPVDSEDSEEIKQQVLALDKIQKALENKEIKKYIHIKNKIISIVV